MVNKRPRDLTDITTPVAGDVLAVDDISLTTATEVKGVTVDNILVFGDSRTATLTNKTIDLTDNTITGTFAEFNTAVSDATLVDLDDSQTLTNKTIDGDDNTFIDINETQQNVSVGVSGTVLTSNGVGVAPTYQAAAGGAPFTDTTSIVEGSADATKEIRFEVDGLTTGTIRVITPPDKDITLVGTNDKLDVFAATSSAELAGVLSDETGSGLLVFGTSPTIITPTIAATGWTNANHAHLAANSGGTITEASISDLQSYLLNVVEDITPQLGGALDGQGNDLNNMGVLFLTEQVEAEADVAGKGQIWVDTQTPNKLFFTDDAGTDFNITDAAAQTPWVADIDADGFDLKDLSNIEFRTTTGAPGAGAQAISADLGGIDFDLPIGDKYDFYINEVLELSIGPTQFDFEGNDLVDIGDIDTARLVVHNIKLSRNENVADDTVIANVEFKAFDGVGIGRQYATIVGTMESDVDTAEEGSMKLQVMDAGSHNTDWITLNDASSGNIELLQPTNVTGALDVTGALTLGTVLAVAEGGTGVGTSTGTVNVVLSNSPTLVTPALGTPASGVATNLTGTSLITGLGAQTQTLDMSNEDIENIRLIDYAVQNVTIATGVITPTASNVKIDTEASASTDDVDTITDAAISVIYYIGSNSSSRDPTLKDAVDNLQLAGGADFTLTSTRDQIMLRQITSTVIVEVSRSDNS